MSHKEDRLTIWRALSDLFLDTELDDTTYQYIARTINESDFTLSEIEQILWYEVYPVLSNNLRSVAGVWDGWSDAWLLQHLNVCDKPGAIHGESFISKEITTCWSYVVELLQRDYHWT